MNKKQVFGFVFVVLFILSLISIISVVYAQSADSNTVYSSDTQSGFNVDRLPKTPEEAKQASVSYLKQEWSKILEKNQFGRVILSIGDFFSVLSPVFKILIGVEYSLSWYFTFAFIIWIAFFVFFLKLGRGAFPGKIFIILPLAFIITSFIGISGAIVDILNTLAFLISDPIAIWIAFFIALFILALFWKFGDLFAKLILNYRKNAEKTALEGDKKIISSTASGLKRGFFSKKGK